MYCRFIMSTSLATMIRLRAIQNRTRELFREMNDLHYRLQFHPDLSAAGWHLAHGHFYENYWLHEVIQNNNAFTADKSLFMSDSCPKAERGPRLEPLADVIKKIAAQQDANDILLMEKDPPLSEHPLFADEYIENHIIQHYAQHYEMVCMIQHQINIRNDKGNYQPEQLLQPSPAQRNMAQIQAGEYQIGGEKTFAYDNELPQHKKRLDAFNIAITPVSNSEYLNFMQQGGYRNRELWSDAGWQWLQQNAVNQPQHWKQNQAQQWYGIDHQGAHDLGTDDPVHGINYYEACAYANWINARLPHEHEWEVAACLEQLSDTARVWEWCANSFYAYENFRAFPAEKSSSDFSSGHKVLKGGSPHTRPEIKRASFRSFYLPHQRHMLSGLRLAFD